jgi:hypothetical protein
LVVEELHSTKAPDAGNAQAHDLNIVLNRCAELFELTSAGGPDVIYNAVGGLRHVLLAMEFPHPGLASPDSIKRTVGAIQAAAYTVSEDVSKSLAADQVYFGMAAASGIVDLWFGRPASELRQYSRAVILDRVDHTAILADELDALHRRREISARGNALHREFMIRRAMEATADGATLH